jgi:PII-like signaling protein
LSEDLPIAVVIVDREERIREFLSSKLDELQIDGLIVLEDIEVIRYAGRDRSSQ